MRTRDKILSNKANKDPVDIYYFDIWGKRKSKFEQLNNLSIENINWIKIVPRKPNLLFVPKLSKEYEGEYKSGFRVADLFELKSKGIVTMGDSFIISQDRGSLSDRIENFLYKDCSESGLKDKFSLGKNYPSWILKNKKDINFDPNKIVHITYRPFDYRYVYLDNKLVWRTRTNTMKHLLAGDNIAMIFLRQVKASKTYQHLFVSQNIIDSTLVSNKTSEISYVLPLYFSSEEGVKNPNLNKEILNKIENKVGTIVPEDIFDYIYAVLHSPSYRKKYKEFLKIDFPHVPYPKDKESFSKLVELGTELRKLHLLQSPKVDQFITTYLVEGSSTVVRPKYKDGKVFINKNQYFGNVPEVTWHFYIGCYQPAQKWLKDRKGRTLNNSELEHYQKIIVALTETDRIMKKIDTVWNQSK